MVVVAELSGDVVVVVVASGVAVLEGAEAEAEASAVCTGACCTSAAAGAEFIAEASAAAAAGATASVEFIAEVSVAAAGVVSSVAGLFSSPPEQATKPATDNPNKAAIRIFLRMSFILLKYILAKIEY